MDEVLMDVIGADIDKILLALVLLLGGEPETTIDVTGVDICAVFFLVAAHMALSCLRCSSFLATSCSQFSAFTLALATAASCLRCSSISWLN